MLPVNDTPFVLERFAIFSKEGAETLVVVLKGTFELAPGKPPAVAREQDPIAKVDVYSGEPGLSGILVEGDLVPPKPGTGVTLTAHAVAAAGKSRQAEVGLRVGALMQTAVVYGNRRWETILGLAHISTAEPFDRMPLTWENAFGGADQTPKSEKDWEFQADNQVGKGFFARKTRKPVAGMPLPNIEHPLHLIRSPRDRPPVVGFCPVAPHWQPRAAYAGTYDDQWRQERAPLFPEDFNPWFFQSAPRNLSAVDYLTGGEPCVVIGTTPEGRLEFSLPTLAPGFRLRWPTGAISLLPQLDTVHIDTDRMRLHLIWRAAQEIHGRLESLSAVEAFLNPKGGR
jgi:hypothetical protein